MLDGFMEYGSRRQETGQDSDSDSGETKRKGKGNESESVKQEMLGWLANARK